MMYFELNGWLLICGGYDWYHRDHCFRRNLRDSSNTEWQSAAKMPAPRNRLGAMVPPKSQFGYVVTGRWETCCGTDKIFTYDSESNTWAVQATNPVKHKGACVTQLENEFWFMGGASGCCSDSAEVWGFNWETKAYSRKPDMPFGVSAPACNAIEGLDGKKYVLVWGTYKFNGFYFIDEMFKFDVASNSWTHLSNPRHPWNARKHGFPYNNGIMSLNSLEYYIINKYDDFSKQIWQWDLDRQNFTEIGLDLAANSGKKFAAGTVIHLRDVWNCIPQTKAWILWSSQYFRNLFGNEGVTEHNEGMDLYISKESMEAQMYLEF